MEEELILNEYQKAPIKCALYGTGNIVISAKAGSGKTTNIKQLAIRLPRDKKIVFLAFNNSIAKEIGEDMKEYSNIKCMTFHSLGEKILFENFGDITVNRFKYNNYFNGNINSLSDGTYDTLINDAKIRFKHNCLKLVDLSRYNKAQCIKEINNVCEKYGIVCESNEASVVLKMLKWGKSNTNEIDFTDMEWLPYELGLATHIYKFDWVLIDEAQDTSPLRQELYKKCLKRGSRYVSIGDLDQAINAWCGADSSAFENFMNEPNTQTFELPISYRCPKKVIELLQTIVPSIKARDGAIEGEVNYNVSPYAVKEGDMVLCRNSAPLVVLQNDLLKKNIKSYIKGAEIGRGLIEAIESTGTEDICFDFERDGIIPRLYRDLLSTLKSIMVTSSLDFETAIQTDAFMKKYDEIKTIEIIGNKTIDYNYLVDRIKAIYKDEEAKGVCLCTAHKAKGLESDNVFILCPSLIPSPLAHKDWEIKSERNLQYVAYSRAKKSLNFIDEEMFSVRRGFGDVTLISESIKDINNKLYNIYGINILDKVSITPNVVKRGTSVTVRESGCTTQKKSVGAKKFKNFLN